MAQRYDTYKDSGVLPCFKGLKEIPAHWSIIPFRYLFYNLDHLRKPISANERPQSNPIYDYYGASGVIDKIDFYNVDDTTLLIGEDGANLRMRNLPLIYKASGRYWVNNHAHVLKPIRDDYNYLALLLESMDYNDYITGAAQPKLSQESLNKIRTILPPYREQVAISSYLDDKCGMIDEWIEKKQKEVELLGEMKQRVIADAVTRGLNREVKMKPTNIPWLPEVPEHWEEKRLSSQFTGDILSNKDFEYKHAFKFNYGQLVPKNEIGDPEEYREIYIKYSIVEKGDILINGLNLNYDFISQRVACAPSDGIITSAYVVCRPRQDVNYDYFTWLFKAMDYQKLFHGMGTGIRLTLSFKELKKQILPIPPLEEQKSIVDFVTARTAKIDKMVENVNREIESLKEYKQRLISDVVTGQIKVC